MVRIMFSTSRQGGRLDPSHRTITRGSVFLIIKTMSRQTNHCKSGACHSGRPSASATVRDHFKEFSIHGRAGAGRITCPLSNSTFSEYLLCAESYIDGTLHIPRSFRVPVLKEQQQQQNAQFPHGNQVFTGSQRMLTFRNLPSQAQCLSNRRAKAAGPQITLGAAEGSPI